MKSIEKKNLIRVKHPSLMKFLISHSKNVRLWYTNYYDIYSQAQRNFVYVEVSNNLFKAMTLSLSRTVGLIYFWSTGYKFQKGVSQQKFNGYFRCESLEGICNQVNKFTNLLEDQNKRSNDLYPWWKQANLRTKIRWGSMRKNRFITELMFDSKRKSRSLMICYICVRMLLVW